MGSARRASSSAIGLLLLLAACDGPSASVADADASAVEDAHAEAGDVREGGCLGPLHALEPALGQFQIRDDQFSMSEVAILGQVYDRVPAPTWLGGSVTRGGECALFRPAPWTCPEDCLWACSPDSECIDAARQDVGRVTLTGLELSPLVLEPADQVPVYTAALPRPASGAGARIELRAEGGIHGPFGMSAVGVGQLEVPEQDIVLQAGQPVSLRWTSPETTAPLCMHIELRLSESTWIECTVDDTGEYAVPAGLVAQMLAFSPSGSRGVTFARRSRGTAAIGPGEVYLDLVTTSFRPVEIPGHAW